LHDRGYTGDSTSPIDQDTASSASIATTDPRWCPSTNPERTTSTRTAGSLTTADATSPRN